ncbi:MAG: serine hydrolase domain-containing protein [bacterium]|nr:serine hydrolase domain-containing protein [bacterium]
MPTTPVRNLMYLAALPLLAPSPGGQMTHLRAGEALRDPKGYERLLVRHHVLGSTLRLSDGARFSQVDTSIRKPAHHAQSNTLYRVASITKTATALVTLRLHEQEPGLLDAQVAQLLPDGEAEEALRGVTVRQLLSHTSGLRDTPALDQALAQGGSWHDVLRHPAVRGSRPGERFCYCNFAFGLLGCALEQLSGQTVDGLFREQLFDPIGMDAALDASTLDRSRMMPISRVLPYHSGRDVLVTPLGGKSLTAPDPLRHFGHTAGAMYTTALSLSRMLTLINQRGAWEHTQLLKPTTVDEMTRQHATYGAASPGMHYGLGLVLLRDPSISGSLVIGHQGYAYGCADGAFLETETGRQMVFLNGGCSEARDGRLGLCNRDLLRWALGKELPAWK